jgi:hypothetical protein
MSVAVDAIVYNGHQAMRYTADCLLPAAPAAAAQAWRRAIEIYDRIDPKLGAKARESLAQVEAAASG